MAVSPNNPVVSGRMTANLDGEFVVVLIGMRVSTSCGRTQVVAGVRGDATDDPATVP
jgi:hypothetical protein